MLSKMQRFPGDTLCCAWDEAWRACPIQRSSVLCRQKTLLDAFTSCEEAPQGPKPQCAQSRRRIRNVNAERARGASRSSSCIQSKEEEDGAFRKQCTTQCRDQHFTREGLVREKLPEPGRTWPRTHHGHSNNFVRKKKIRSLPRSYLTDNNSSTKSRVRRKRDYFRTLAQRRLQINNNGTHV